MANEDHGAAVNRRGAIRLAVSGAVFYALTPRGEAAARPAGKPQAGGAESRPSQPREAEVTPGEDLMQEHGVLERILLIYEAAMEHLREPARGRPGHAAPLTAVARGAAVVRRFVEDYHEKLEEDLVFPRLEKSGREVELVSTLRLQHRRGRLLTARVQKLAGARRLAPGDRAHLIADLGAFIRMYRPHAAREDTVLFPAFRAVVGSDVAYRELGERFEEREHQVLGREGFEGAVKEVAAIEQALGIGDLAAFTPT